MTEKAAEHSKKRRPTDIISLNLGLYVTGPKGDKIADGLPPDGTDMRTASPGKDGWKALTYGNLLSMLVMALKGDSAADRAKQFRLAMRIGDAHSDPDSPALNLPVSKAQEILDFIQKLPNDHQLAAPIYQGSAIVFLEDAIERASKGAPASA